MSRSHASLDILGGVVKKMYSSMPKKVSNIKNHMSMCEYVNGCAEIYLSPDYSQYLSKSLLCFKRNYDLAKK